MCTTSSERTSLDGRPSCASRTRIAWPRRKRCPAHRCPEESCRARHKKKKNWLLFGAGRRGPTKRQDLHADPEMPDARHRPRAYLKDILERLPKIANQEVAQVTPLKWKEAVTRGESCTPHARPPSLRWSNPLTTLADSELARWAAFNRLRTFGTQTSLSCGGLRPKLQTLRMALDPRYPETRFGINLKLRGLMWAMATAIGKRLSRRLA